MKARFAYKNEAGLALISQALCMAMMSALLWVGGYREVALACGLGGLIAFLPNLYAFKKAFSITGASNAKRIRNVWMQGQMAKWLLTALGFWLAAKNAALSPIGLFAGFINAQVGFVILPLIIAIRNKRVI